MTFSFEKLSQLGNPQSNFTSSVCKWTVYYSWAIVSQNFADVSFKGKPVKKNTTAFIGLVFQKRQLTLFFEAFINFFRCRSPLAVFCCLTRMRYEKLIDLCSNGKLISEKTQNLLGRRFSEEPEVVVSPIFPPLQFLQYSAKVSSRKCFSTTLHLEQFFWTQCENLSVSLAIWCEAVCKTFDTIEFFCFWNSPNSATTSPTLLK